MKLELDGKLSSGEARWRWRRSLPEKRAETREKEIDLPQKAGGTWVLLGGTVWCVMYVVYTYIVMYDTAIVWSMMCDAALCDAL
jgi:hypothetical protein